MDAQNLIDNFSTHLKNVIARAISIAASFGHTQVEPVHLFYAVSKEVGSVGAEILKKFQITSSQILNKSSLSNEKLKKDKNDLGNLPELSLSSRQILEKALVIAHQKGHSFIGTEHLLSGLINAKQKDIISVFVSLGIEHEQVKEALENAFENTGRFSQMQEVKDMFEDLPPMPSLGPLPAPLPPLPSGQKNQNAIAMFTTDLTAKGEQAKLDPVIGREAEVERVINILARRTKNNPILIGEPGVGKTAIVEGLAKRIAEGDVPDILKRKKIIALDLTLLIAGTIYRGEFETRLKQIVDECSANPNYILFIDELHNIIGAGSNQGTMDAANILKPALARGQLHCIGATTYDEYKKYVQNDPALERRFQMIHIEEPSDSETLEILQGIKKYYEDFHHLNIDKKALSEALYLSNRYIHDNFQPDKSIDLIDEACGSVRALQKESEQESQCYQLEKQIEKYETAKSQAIGEEQLQTALNWKKKIAVAKKQLKKIKQTKPSKLKKLRVTEKHIRDVLSKKMHIDKALLYQNEWDNITALEAKLKESIIGQDKVIAEVVQSLKRAQLGMKNQDQPFASFLFVGPSGVGKTELAKKMAKELYHDKNALIKLDMSEFSESHSVAKLLGSPAGYIGYKDRNPYLEKLSKRPYSVLLFDEVDKAHRDVVKLLLQMLDEGYLNDQNGKKISLKHTIIILTTNLGTQLFKSHGIGFHNSQTKQNDIGPELKQSLTNLLKEELSNALLSRLETLCIFRPLDNKNLEQITSRYLKLITKHLEANQGLKILPDNRAIKYISQTEADNLDLGARHLEKKVEQIIHELVVDLLKKQKNKKQTYTLTYQQHDYRLI